MNITEDDLKKAATEYTQTLEQAKQKRDEIIRRTPKGGNRPTSSAPPASPAKPSDASPDQR